MLTAHTPNADLERLEGLACTCDDVDDRGSSHRQRVASLSANIAEALGLTAYDVRVIQRAARLHDIGKVAVPRSVLVKRSALNENEQRLIQCHTEIGGALLAQYTSEILGTARLIVLSHHEKFDGSGYPSGRRGGAIPLAGRIVAVADVFDALVHVRPYKAAWSFGAAVDEIQRLSGTHFDPTVVRAFFAALRGRVRASR